MSARRAKGLYAMYSGKPIKDPASKAALEDLVRAAVRYCDIELSDTECTAKTNMPGMQCPLCGCGLVKDLEHHCGGERKVKP